MLRPVLLTTDCGAEIDDQFALAHQALSPVIDLRAVVTTHIGEHKTLGDSASEFTAASAQDVLSNLPLATVPDVVAGAPLPLAARGQPHSCAGADRILAEASRFSAHARLSVLAIGAVTDVASALLLDSTLAERIEVLAMGYNAWPDGGDPFNVKNDIFAWQALLDSSVPLTVGDSAVCKAHLVLTPESVGTRFPETAAATYIKGLFKAWVEAHDAGAAFFSPLRHGLLLGKYLEPPDFDAGDVRSSIPAFEDEALLDRLQSCVAALRERFRDHPQPVLWGLLGALFEDAPTACALVGQRNAEQSEAAALCSAPLSAKDAAWVRELYAEVTV